MNDRGQPRNTSRIGMIGIIAEFVPDVQVDEQAGCETDRKAENIDQRDRLLPQETAGSYFQVVSRHVSGNWLGFLQKWGNFWPGFPGAIAFREGLTGARRRGQAGARR